jgi:hypothetical protein
MATKSAEPTDEVSLRAAVQSACLQVLQPSSAASPSATASKTVNVIGSGVLSIAELTYIYATQCLGPDLVAFAQHRRSSPSARTRITAEDVLLAARKNPGGALDKLRSFLKRRRQPASAAADSSPPFSNAKTTKPHQARVGRSTKAAVDVESLSSSSSSEEELERTMHNLTREKKQGYSKSASKSPPSVQKQQPRINDDDEEDDEVLEQALATIRREKAEGFTLKSIGKKEAMAKSPSSSSRKRKRKRARSLHSHESGTPRKEATAKSPLSSSRKRKRKKAKILPNNNDNRTMEGRSLPKEAKATRHFSFSDDDDDDDDDDLLRVAKPKAKSRTPLLANCWQQSSDDEL